MSGPGIYWVLVNLLDGSSHRYSIHAVDGQDAEEYVSRHIVPKDYPGQRFAIAGCGLAGAGRSRL